MRLTIMGKNNCPYCDLAKRHLDENKIPYEYILFLHSKSNPETCRKYFEPLINNLDDNFIENINLQKK